MRYIVLLVFNQFLFSGSWFWVRYCAGMGLSFEQFWTSLWGFGFALLYATASFNYLILIKKVKLLRLSAVSSALAMIITILSGVFLLREPFPVKNMILLALAMLALFCFYLGQQENARTHADKK